MTIHFDNFKYAGDKDTDLIVAAYPKIREVTIAYDFKSDHIMKSMDLFIVHNDFTSWLIRLLNKLNDLRFSYFQISFSLNKGIPDKDWKIDKKRDGTYYFEGFKTESDEINKFLFDFYSECFYYHYFSSLDIIYKTLNKFFLVNIGEGERNKFNHKVREGIKPINPSLYTVLVEFGDMTKPNRFRRNSFTHNYAVNEIDFRSKQVQNDNRKTTRLMDPSYTTSDQIFSEIQSMIELYIPVLRFIEEVFVKEESKIFFKL